jgi:hypothetical protein
MNNGGTHSPARRTRARVFISYRRRFDQSAARDLRGRLVAALGPKSVFRDVNDIPPGENFEQVIREAVKSCDTLLALISPGWLDAAASLREPKDYVRLEIAGALREGLRVIPVLIGGARMPRGEDWPEDMRELAARQAEELSEHHWDEDVRRLIAAIRPPRSFAGKLLDAARAWPGVVALAVLLLGAGYAVWRAVSTSPRSLEQCFGEFLPRGRSASIGVTDTGWRVIVPQNHAEGEPAGIVLTEHDQRLVAVRLRFLPGGKDAAGKDTGSFKVEGVVGPDCRPVESYSNLGKGGQQVLLDNYDYLGIRAGERQYVLRIAYTRNAIQAQSHLKWPPD